MTRKRHTPEEIIKKLREAATLLAGGQSVKAVCKKLDVAPPTYHRWRQEYGGAKEETVKRLQALEKENTQIKKLVADLSLDKAMLKGARGGSRLERDSQRRSAFARRAAPEGAGNMVGPARKREAIAHLEGVLEVSERRACKVMVQARSTQRYQGRKRGKDAALAAELRRLAHMLTDRLLTYACGRRITALDEPLWRRSSPNCPTKKTVSARSSKPLFRVSYSSPVDSLLS